MQHIDRTRPRVAKRRRALVPALAAVLAAIAGAVLPVSPAAASTVFKAPYSSVYSDTQQPCIFALGAAPPPPGVGQCSFTPNTSAATGEMSATAILQSPVAGLVPWQVWMLGDTGVALDYHLASPTPQLTLTVTIHVKSASVSIDNSLPALPGWLPDTFSEFTQSDIAGASIGAIALEAACHCAGGGGPGMAIVARDVSGTSSLSNQDYTFSFTLAKGCSQFLGIPTSPPCGDLPAGDVRIIPEVTLDLRHTPGWGTETAQIDAVATSITVG